MCLLHLSERPYEQLDRITNPASRIPSELHRTKPNSDCKIPTSILVAVSLSRSLSRSLRAGLSLSRTWPKNRASTSLCALPGLRRGSMPLWLPRLWWEPAGDGWRLLFRPGDLDSSRSRFKTSDRVSSFALAEDGDRSSSSSLRLVLTGVLERALRSTLARGEGAESSPRRPGERSFAGE